MPAGVAGAAAIIGLFVYIVIGFVYCGLCMLMCSVVWFVFVVVIVVGSRCEAFGELSIVWAL